MASTFAKLLSSKRLKPSQLVQHVARTKKTLRDLRQILLAHRAAPTPETAAQVADMAEKLVILLAGQDPAQTALADVVVDEK